MLTAQATEITVSRHGLLIQDTLISRPMPSSIDSKTLVSVENGLLYLLKVSSRKLIHNGNMKKNVSFAALQGRAIFVRGSKIRGNPTSLNTGALV